jgi:hypothetical protein
MANLTTKEVCELFGIPYQDLLNLYYSLEDRLPVEKVGRNLVWSPEAVAAARRMLAIRRQKKAMRQTAEAQSYLEAVARLRKTGSEIRNLGESLLAVYEDLKKNPPTATGFIHSLPDDHLRLITPLAVLLSPTAKKRWKAALAEAALETEGDTREQAMAELRRVLVRTYNLLRSEPASDPEMWQTFQQLIRPKRPLPWLTRSEERLPSGGEGDLGGA